MKVDVFETSYWYPLSSLNISHFPFRLNSNTIIHTWATLALLLIILLPVRWLLKNKKGSARFVILTIVKAFMDLCTQTFGKFSKKHFYFITSLFIFIFACNSISLIPSIEEPTQDLNTALAVGLISFLYIQIFAIKSKGIYEYVKEYFDPFFLMFPLNIVGKLASIVSISFRLFGNIFGGSVISTIYLKAIGGSFLLESLGIISGINFVIALFFGLFEGFLQAFVFAMLTITYLAMETQSDEPVIGDAP